LELVRERPHKLIERFVVALSIERPKGCGDVIIHARRKRQRILPLQDARIGVSKPLSPHSNQQVSGHQQTRRIVVRLPLDTFFRLARPADNGRRGWPTEQESLRRVFGEQATMKAVPTALMRQRKAKSAFLERVLLRVKALIDYDAMFIEVDRAENVRIAFGIARNSEHSMGVVELDAELQMLFDDILDGDGRFNDNTSRLGKLSQQRSCVTLDPILRKIGDKFRHQVVILSSAS
jgi:hypothetical protein